MQKEINYTNSPKDGEIKKEDNNAEGYPLYPPSEDIYNQSINEEDVDPEKVFLNKEFSEIDALKNTEQENAQEAVNNGLDVPGSELDDVQENTGNEDEENNYYSIGGDNHDDLEEDKGD